MNVSEEREDGVSTSKVTFSEKHDSQTRAKSQVKLESADSSGDSHMFMKTDRSVSEPLEFNNRGDNDKQM